MRRLMKLLVVLAALLLPVCASAMTELEWNRKCHEKTTQSVTIYERETIYQEATSTDLGVTGQGAVWRAVGSLPAGAYVQHNSRYDDFGYTYIGYWKNGGVSYGYVKTKPFPLTSARVYVQIVTSSGYIAVTEVSDTYLDDLDALRAYIKKNNSGSRLLEEHEKDDLEWGPGDSLWLKQDSASSKDETSNGEQISQDKKPSTTKPTTSTTKKSTKKKVEKMTLDISLAVESETLPVTVKLLGVHESIVKVEGEETTVPTTQLRYETTADSENALAIIYAKNTGEVILRPQQETTGRVTKCKTGRVALVIEKGKSWSKLWYDGHVGYVQNKYLQFIPMAEAATDAAVGSKNAPMHLGTHRDTRVVKQVKKGSPIEKLWQGETWAEVAVDGYRGYIQLKYLAE
ncbi:MAG: hypothetical protein IJX84_12240 [Clostridia bacterium]|nr:hypothetical protein [Clostridia bacterium]